MIRLRHKLFIQLFRLFDVALMMVTLFLVIVIAFEKGDLDRISYLFRVAYRLEDGLGLLAVLAGWAFVLNLFIRYDANRFNDLLPQIVDVLKATTVCAFLLIIVGEVFEVGRFNRWVILLFWLITSGLMVLSRVVIHQILKALRRSGRNYRHLLIIGNRLDAEQLADRIERRPELGYKIEGLLVPEPNQLTEAKSNWPLLGALDRLKGILEKGVVDEVIVNLPLQEHFATGLEIVQLGKQLGVVVRLLPTGLDLHVLSRSQVEVFEGRYVITFFREAQLWHLLAKRLVDILVSGTLLILLVPLFLVVGLIVKFSTPGPVFFVQERVGMNKRRFRMYKFRSMYIDAEKRKADLAHLNEMSGPVFKIRNDPRITPVGRFLRKTSIDELPQLLNVLKGEMSLVGPRPPVPSEVDKYEWLNRRRLSIRPGLTCLWQVSGRNELTFDQWMELDRQYIENWSFWLDLHILLRTIPVVLLGKGAS
ncbi:MAG: sugar transferase [Verrucomicrobia bacterium]|nr:sugar transferase [Verrucomicrobiota bacterium]